MRPIRTLIAIAGLSAAAGAPAVAWSQAFEITGRPVEMTWPTRDWNGRHIFGQVFCVAYPDPQNALVLTQVMFNRNTLYLARTRYSNNIAIYVATSVIPAGRSATEEVTIMREANRRGAQSAPTEITTAELSSDFGPMAGLTIRNAVEGSATEPFPFVRRIAKPGDGSLRSLSVHRLFARGPDRIEVAGLQYFASPIQAAGEQEATAGLTAIVDAVVKSLQACTANMPLRNR